MSMQDNHLQRFLKEDEIDISGPDYACSRFEEMPKAYINTGKKNSKLERESRK